MATLNEILGGDTTLAGLLGAEAQAQAEQRAQNAALLNFGLNALMRSQGQPGQPRPGLGQVLAASGIPAVSAYQQSFDKTLTDALKGLQVQELLRKRQESEQIRKLAPQVFQVTRAEPTTGPFDLAGTGAVPEQPITGVRVNRELLPALGALGPAGMEYASQVAQFEKSLRPERVTLKPGEQVVEPDTGRVVAKVAPTPDRVDLGTHVAFYDPSNPTKIIGALPKGKDLEKVTSTELQVGQQFTAQAAPFISIGQAYKKIETAAQNPSAAGDISLLYGYMRILDPASTVREGEFATAQNAGSIPEAIRARYNKAVNGEMLTTVIRNDFVNQAKNLVTSQKEIYDQTIRPKFDSIVETNNLNKTNVMFDPFAGIDLKKQPAPVKAQPAARETPTVRQTMQGGATGGITVRRIGD